MAGPGVLADVSETMTNALDATLATLFPAPAPTAILHDLATPIPPNPATLAVVLYEVTEDASSRNKPMQRVRNLAGQHVLRKPPLTLILRYMIVPFAGDRLTEQRMLGAAMQTVYDTSVLAGPALQGTNAPEGLVGSDAALAITLDPLTLEERTRVFTAVQRPYRLSMSYQVRVANIDPSLETGFNLVRTRNIDPAVPVNA